MDPERTGLYLAVGYIPFDERDIRPVLEASVEEHPSPGPSGHRLAFSMRRFAGGGYQKAHPLLTFRCLPNMPAYHVSANFDVQGPYVVTYPSAGQFALALEEACVALARGSVDVALVGGVAHQRNFLVEHHFARIVPSIRREALQDSAAFLVLETEASSDARGAHVRGRLDELDIRYRAPDLHRPLTAHEERFEVDGVAQPDVRHFGPASLGVRLGGAWASAGGASSQFESWPATEPAPRSDAPGLRRAGQSLGAGVRILHEVRTSDGIEARSRWTWVRAG
jgi:hypothetical protein